jgi:hypothetical protein
MAYSGILTRKTDHFRASFEQVTVRLTFHRVSCEPNQRNNV